MQAIQENINNVVRRFLERRGNVILDRNNMPDNIILLVEIYAEMRGLEIEEYSTDENIIDFILPLVWTEENIIDMMQLIQVRIPLEYETLMNDIFIIDNTHGIEEEVRGHLLTIRLDEEEPEQEREAPTQITTDCD